MKRHPRLAAPALVSSLLLGAAAHAHVVLPPGGAAAGSTYAAAFKVGHACKGAQSTTALQVALPAGFTLLDVPQHPGWTITRRAGVVTWAAASPQAALPGITPDSFVLQGRLTDKPGTLWFKALQTCDVGSADWSVVPTAATPKPEFPAPHLDVLARGAAAVDVRDAWARPTVTGQTSSGIFAHLSAPAGARLVGVSTPVGDAALHQMTMEGDVMRMREVPDGLDLPPGQTVDLGPSGFHIMLTALKQPLVLGGTIPVTLHFVDRQGRKGDLQLQVPIAQAGATPAGEHEHMH